VASSNWATLLKVIALCSFLKTTVCLSNYTKGKCLSVRCVLETSVRILIISLAGLGAAGVISDELAVTVIYQHWTVADNNNGLILFAQFKA